MTSANSKRNRFVTLFLRVLPESRIPSKKNSHRPQSADNGCKVD